MIDIEEHRCVDCLRLIPVERKYCYLCDLIKNGKPVNSPKNMKELLDQYLQTYSEGDGRDQLAVELNLLNSYIESKKYRITIQ